MKTKKQSLTLKKLREQKEQLKYKSMVVGTILTISTTFLLVFGS